MNEPAIYECDGPHCHVAQASPLVDVGKVTERPAGWAVMVSKNQPPQVRRFHSNACLNEFCEVLGEAVRREREYGPEAV